MRVCWIAHLAHPRTYACYPSLICALPALPIIHTRLTHLRAYAHLHSSISALRAFFLSCYNLNMQDSMVMFTFSVFDQKYPVWVNLVQKIKIVSLSRNLVPVLIWICRSQWWCSLFSFLTENTFLGANFVHKIKIVSLSWNLVPTITHKIFETNSSFHVKWCTTGKV